MIPSIQPIWQQFAETYDALREALETFPEERLHWSAAPGCRTASEMVKHIARGNIVYSHVMEQSEIPAAVGPDLLGRLDLFAYLEVSERKVRQVFEALSEEDARRVCADDWQPLGPLVRGPLDALWFASQIVRHSAYHLGQLNYLMQIGGFGIDY